MRQGDLQKARELFTQSTRQCQKAKDEIGLLYTIEGLSSLQYHRSRLQSAARLYGWTDIMRVKIGNRRPPVEQASIEKEIAELRSQLGDEPFAVLYKEGQALSMDQAIELALED